MRCGDALVGKLESAMSEQGRVVVNDARDGELDLGAVGRALTRKKWWVLGPALAVAALTFVGLLERHVPLTELVEAHPAFDDEAVRLLEPGVAVSRRRTPGGAGPAAVAEQMKQFRDHLARDRARLDAADG